MRAHIVLLSLCLTVVAAASRNSERIIGGSLATISQYPSMVALLSTGDYVTYSQSCAGTILNQITILTAAQCTSPDNPNRWRIRVGSQYANSGGVVHNSGEHIVHPNFDPWDMDSDVALIRTATYIQFVNNAVQAAFIAGVNYYPADNQVVWAAGWGYTAVGGPASEQLRHVQTYTVNHSVCVQRYNSLGWPVTTNMLCAGHLDVGGHDQCQGDNGGPLFHDIVVVGLYSWAYQCGHADYPSVNTRISSFTTWILANV